MKYFNFLRILLILIASTVAATAQVAVLPPVVYIDPATNSGTTNLQNQGNIPKEVNISFADGFINYDNNGEAFLDTTNKKFQKYSIKPYVKVFPKKILIPPFGQQTIRFFANPPGNLSEGTYWTRLVIDARDPKKQIDSLRGQQNSIQMDFRLNVRSNSIVVFPKGNCNAVLKIAKHSIKTVGDNVNLYVDFEKTGNSPVWGTSVIEIKDPSGNIIINEKIPTQLYQNNKVKFSFAKNFFRSGNYTFKITVNNERDEVPENFRIKFSPVSQEFKHTIN